MTQAEAILAYSVFGLALATIGSVFFWIAAAQYRDAKKDPSLAPTISRRFTMRGIAYTLFGGFLATQATHNTAALIISLPLLAFGTMQLWQANDLRRIAKQTATEKRG